MLQTILQALGNQESRAATPANGVCASFKVRRRRISLESYTVTFVFLDAFVIAGSALLCTWLLQASSAENGLAEWQISALTFAICCHFVMSRIFNSYNVKKVLDRSYGVRQLLLGLFRQR